MAKRRSGCGIGPSISLENVRIELREKFDVQLLDSAFEIGLSHDETEVQQGRALGDHTNVNRVKRTKYAACHARRVADVIAHQAYDGLTFFHRHLGEFAERIAATGERLCI